MANICPKDFKVCCDDLCRGSGNCLFTGTELLERCWKCGQIEDPEHGIHCACEPDEEEYTPEGCAFCDAQVQYGESHDSECPQA